MLRGIRLFVFSSHPAWIIVLGDMDKFDDTHTKMSWSLCASVWMAADAHGPPSLYERRLLGTERILLIWTLMKSPARLPLSQLSFSSLFFLIPSLLPTFLQTSTTASQSRAKTEALASTRLIHSSASACPAMEETHARKVRVRRENSAHSRGWRAHPDMRGVNWNGCFAHIADRKKQNGILLLVQPLRWAC